MRPIVLSCSFLLRIAVFCIASLCLPASSSAEDSAECSAVNCDCGNVSAGELTAAWQRDCRECEKRLREICSQNSPPLLNGLKKAGTCEEKCSATGPNPYPKGDAISSWNEWER